MGKYSHLNPDAEEMFFIDKMEDYGESASRGTCKFTNFLDKRQIQLSNAAFSGYDCCQLFFGGFENAERVAIAVHPNFFSVHENDFPITAVTFEFNKNFALNHRDVLGSLMSLGIKRELIGDIIVNDGEIIVFVVNTILPLVLDIEKIGRVGVTAKIGFTSIVLTNITETIVGPCSSMRIDCIVAMLTKESREKAQKLILSSLVRINDKEETKITHVCSAGDVLSIRKYGKFKITEDIRVTKKEKLRIEFLKYI